MRAISVHTLRGSRHGTVRKQTTLLALSIAARATVTMEAEEGDQVHELQEGSSVQFQRGMPFVLRGLQIHMQD